MTGEGGGDRTVKGRTGGGRHWGEMLTMEGDVCEILEKGGLVKRRRGKPENGGEKGYCPTKAERGGGCRLAAKMGVHKNGISSSGGGKNERAGTIPKKKKS